MKAQFRERVDRVQNMGRVKVVVCEAVERVIA